MTKSELIERIAAVQTQLSVKDVELAVKMVLDHMTDALAEGDRIEIRGFGSFSLHYREVRLSKPLLEIAESRIWMFELAADRELRSMP